MQLNILQSPYAGDVFRFEVLGGFGRVRIQVFVDQRKIFDEECADPPCHEELRLPVEASGALLRINAEDSRGDVAEEILPVEPSSDNTPVMA
jgi:hypothetical protein